MGGASRGESAGGFADALSRLTAATGRNDDLCGPFVGASAVSGAVVSTLGSPLGSQTVCASTPLAARIDEIQIDLGEGPCWEALRIRRPVLEPDLRGSAGASWPGVTEAFRGLDVGALFAFPLYVGRVSVGCVDLYSEDAGVLAPGAVEQLTVLAAIAARQVLRRALDDLEVDAQGVEDGPYSRREVHQASGMVAAQLSIGVDDALVVLRGHAFASGQSVRHVANDVVARRLVFDP
jgi:hypothetical protein